jgi:hypothetical protein
MVCYCRRQAFPRGLVTRRLCSRVLLKIAGFMMSTSNWLSKWVAPAVADGLLFGFVLALVAFAIYLAIRIVNRYSQCWRPYRTDNGVRVGAPKVYDNRSLTLMLGQLQNQLGALESIDGGSLTSSLGTTQNERSTSVDSGASLAFSALPSAPSDSAGTVRAGDTPATAAAPLRWSERAADLLDDQINLSYQIFNLRLLLERAISDRLTTNFEPRVQAVVALPISIDTPAFAVDCAATVEVRFTVDDPTQRPSLVALFPQEETYNTLSVDRRGVRGDVSAGSGGVKASAGSTRNSSASAIRRQADIVAVERQPDEENEEEQDAAAKAWDTASTLVRFELVVRKIASAVRNAASKTTKTASKPARINQLVVAWQFRPSAGERSVKSGLRQVLAVLALPSVDQMAADVKVEVEVRSIWESWNAKTGTSGNGAGWRALFTDRPARYRFGNYGKVSVPAASMLEATLAPKIYAISWYRIGLNRACITLNGKNFFAGTTVVMGDGTIDADNGLTIKSEQTLQVVVPVAALLNDALLNGRYGPSIEIASAPDGLPSLRISGVWIDPKPGNQSFETLVDFQSRDGSKISWSRFSRLPLPLFAINNKVLASSFQYDSPAGNMNPEELDTITARIMLTPDLLGTALQIDVRWPLFGSAWALQYQTYFSAAPISVKRTDNGADVVLLISGREFDSSVIVIVNQCYRLKDNLELVKIDEDINDVLQLTLSRTIVDAHHELFLWQMGRATVPVQIPRSAEIAAPILDGSQKPRLLQTKTSCSIDYTGFGLQAVRRVFIDQREQAFSIYRDGASIEVLVDGESIAEAGKYDISFETAAGDRLTAPIFVVPPSNGAPVKSEVAQS